MSLAFCQHYSWFACSQFIYFTEKSADESTKPYSLAELRKIRNDADLAKHYLAGNDAFELWVLLHFEDIDPADIDTQHRTYYYKQLKEIFKTLPEPCEQLQAVLAHPNFGYKHRLKSKTNFREIVLPLIFKEAALEDATRRAKGLVVHHDATVNCSAKAPCTLVHTLVERILEKGGNKPPA